MKFIVSTGTLLKQLQIINGVIASKVVIPILDIFFLKWKTRSFVLWAPI
jgi:DNA polymerase III sliding clamp (beta) subunit (PCNA family)